MERLAFFFDGFNLYHALDDTPGFHRYKWLDLSKMARCFFPRHLITRILYFTAYDTRDLQGLARHQTYVKALQAKGIEIVLGKFKRKDKFCKVCRSTFLSVEEKQTDVNIAIKLFQLALQDQYDRAVIVSGDSDLVPAIEAVRQSFIDKKVHLIAPVGKRGRWAIDLKTAADGHMQMKEKHLATSQLPDPFDLGGGSLLHCPPSWK